MLIFIANNNTDDFMLEI